MRSFVLGWLEQLMCSCHRRTAGDGGGKGWIRTDVVVGLSSSELFALHLHGVCLKSRAVCCPGPWRDSFLPSVLYILCYLCVDIVDLLGQPGERWEVISPLWRHLHHKLISYVSSFLFVLSWRSHADSDSDAQFSIAMLRGGGVVFCRCLFQAICMSWFLLHIGQFLHLTPFVCRGSRNCR